MSRVYEARNTPEDNLRIMAENPYIGRIITGGWIGKKAVQGCAITGRSDDSKNRVYVVQNGIVSTETFDKTRPPKKPELTIYDPMRPVGSVHVVSNGDQTTTAAQFLRSGFTFEDAMNSRFEEPDAPNNTNRISGFIDIDPRDGQPRFGISVIRKYVKRLNVAELAEGTARAFYTERSGLLELEDGVGYGVQTYTGNEDPLPAFAEPPFKIPLEDTALGMAEMLRAHMNPDTFVAVAGKTIDTVTGEVDIRVLNMHGDQRDV